MYPDWVLFLNIFICLLNLYLGIKLIPKKISVIKSYRLVFISVIIGIIVSNFYNLT